MSSIGAYEAKTHLPRLLDEVEAGASFTITKHGRPVARLIGLKAAPSEDLVEQFQHARSGLTLGLSVKDARAEGRR